MSQGPNDLRKKAAAARRAARKRTTGGTEADRHLEELAVKLEQEASELERAGIKPDEDTQ